MISSKYKLGDEKFVIMDTHEASPPCTKCNQSTITRVLKATKATISDILSHVSDSDDTIYKYRFKVDGLFLETYWRNEKEIYDTEEQANKAIKEKESCLNEK